MRKPKASLFFGLFLVSLWLAACRPAPVGEAIPWQALPLEAGVQVAVEVNSGQVIIRGHEGADLQISGEMRLPEQVVFEVTQADGQIKIQANYQKRAFDNPSQAPVVLEIGLPYGATIQVSTFDAPVTLQEVRGDVNVDSVAGDILAEGLGGNIQLRSGRGDIRATGITGRLIVLGEHGLLSIENSRGEVGSSTIMGTIRYSGTPGLEDEIRLETDHGPVQIDLKPEASLSISANSASGNVVCMLPDMRSTTRNCSGSLGEGEGALKVYTVSGEIRLRITP